jgi:uracil-DNA glycosylase
MFSKAIPRQLGALCDKCPLKSFEYVESTINPNTTLVIGEYPIRYLYTSSLLKKEPFAGETRNVMEDWLISQGKTWNDISTTNVVSCFTAKSGKLSNRPPEVSIRCCLPRLKNEVAQFQKIITFGHLPLYALGISGNFDSTTSWQNKIVYIAYHPATRKWSDIEKEFIKALK